jgi:hypothetical protein
VGGLTSCATYDKVELARTLYAWAAIAGERAEEPMPNAVFIHFSSGAVQTTAPPPAPNQKPKYFSAGDVMPKIVMAVTSSYTGAKCSTRWIAPSAAAVGTSTEASYAAAPRSSAPARRTALGFPLIGLHTSERCLSVGSAAMANKDPLKGTPLEDATTDGE